MHPPSGAALDAKQVEEHVRRGPGLEPVGCLDFNPVVDRGELICIQQGAHPWLDKPAGFKWVRARGEGLQGRGVQERSLEGWVTEK